MSRIPKYERLPVDVMRDRITDEYYRQDPEEDWPGWYARGRANEDAKHARQRVARDNDRWVPCDHCDPDGDGCDRCEGRPVEELPVEELP